MRHAVNHRDLFQLDMNADGRVIKQPPD